jgi:WD40 repeat protein
VALAQENGTAPKNKTTEVDEKTIRALIEKLGDGDFDVREAAQKQLTDVGEPALALLRTAAKNHADLEVRERLGQLIQKIGSSFFVEVRKFERKGYWTSRLVMAADGKHVVAVSGGALRSLNLDDGKENVRFDFPSFPGNTWGLGLSADGQRVIVASEDQVARIYNLKTGKLIKELQGHAGAVNGAALLPDGKRAITAGADQSLRLWDIDSGRQLRAFDNVPRDIFSLGLSPDGKLVAGALSVISELEEPGDIGIWEVESGRRIHLLKGHTKRLCSVRFSPDGKTLLSSSFDHTARLWDVAQGKLLKTFVGHEGKLESAAFTPDGKRFVSVGNQDNPVVILWDVASGERLFQSVSLSAGLLDVVTLADGRHCVTCGKDGTVRLWQWTR